MLALSEFAPERTAKKNSVSPTTAPNNESIARAVLAFAAGLAAELLYDPTKLVLVHGLEPCEATFWWQLPMRKGGSVTRNRKPAQC